MPRRKADGRPRDDRRSFRRQSLDWRGAAVFEAMTASAWSRRRRLRAGWAADDGRQRRALSCAGTSPATGCADRDPAEEAGPGAASSLRPMPSDTSRRRWKWRGCSQAIPRHLPRPCAFPKGSAFRSRNSATIIPTSRPRGANAAGGAGAAGPGRARHGAFRMASPTRNGATLAKEFGLVAKLGYAALFPDRPRYRALCPIGEASCARGAARPPIPWSAIASASPMSGRSHGHAVRALHLDRARRAAGHRRRFRA